MGRATHRAAKRAICQVDGFSHQHVGPVGVLQACGRSSRAANLATSRSTNSINFSARLFASTVGNPRPFR